ncbi:MAG TPA: cupin domain-containing protein [Gemmatimonadales bacterium]|nr:cupin domain-containing protein [Gemmatimonadales bacterium]
MARILGSVLAAVPIAVAACSPRPAAPPAAPAIVASPAPGLVLSDAEGERRMRRPRPGGQRGTGTPIIIKVDGTNGGSSQLFMGYEDIPVGEAIQRHYHPHADEIVFVHRGTGVATLGDRPANVAAGATIYIPHGTRVTLRNTGDEPITIAFVFADPTMSGWFRDGTVPEGDPAPAMTADEVAARRERHREHIVVEPSVAR